jgi:hypothetical protein
MRQDSKEGFARRDFLRTAAGSMMAGSLLGGAAALALPGCSANRNAAAYRYWQQRDKGTMTDAQYIAMCGTLAPSAHNTQPWKFQVQGERIRVYADISRHLGSADAEWRMMLMSIGCAVENMTVGAQRLGYSAAVEQVDADRQFAANGYCATVKLARTGIVNHPWFDAIFARQTTRTTFDAAVPVPVALTTALDRQATLPGIHLAWFSTPAAAANVAGLTRESVRSFLEGDSRHRDGMKWFRIKRQEWERKGDGIAVFNSDAPAYAKEWVERFATQQDLLGKQFKQGEIDSVDRMAHATALWGLVYADGVSSSARVRAGRMAERVYLEATARGYAVQPLCYPTEMPETAAKLKISAGLALAAEPLFLFRIGKSDLVSKSVRRNLSDVIMA